MHIFIKTGFLLLCFIVLNTHAHAIEEFDTKAKLGKESGFKVIDIEIRKPTYKYGAGICATDSKESIILSLLPNQINKEVLIEIHGSNFENFLKDRKGGKTNKLTITRQNGLREVPAHVNYLMCNSLNDYGNLVLRAYIDAVNMRNNRRDEFHQLYQGFYDLITSNEEGEIILKDIIEPALHNLQIMDRIKAAQNHEIPTLIASLIIVSPLIEKLLEIQNGNSTTQLMQPRAQSFVRSFSVDYLTHPITTGGLSFMIVGGIGYITTNSRGALLYAMLGGIAGFALPHLYHYQTKH